MGEKKKEDDFVYYCSYCNKVFDHSKEASEHQQNCKLRPISVIAKTKPTLEVWEGVKFGFGFAFGLSLFSLISILVLSILGISFFRSLGF